MDDLNESLGRLDLGSPCHLFQQTDTALPATLAQQTPPPLHTRPILSKYDDTSSKDFGAVSADEDDSTPAGEGGDIV